MAIYGIYAHLFCFSDLFIMFFVGSVQEKILKMGFFFCWKQKGIASLKLAFELMGGNEERFFFEYKHV